MFLNVIDLNKIINEKEILKNINVSIEENEIIGLIGHNGAGKTTFFKILLRILDYDSGKVLYSSNHHFNIKDDIGYLPEQRGLNLNQKVSEQLMDIALLKNIDKQTAAADLDYWLNFFQISSYKNKKIMELSKGNQQKIQFISSIINRPAFLILDEPFSGLDPINKEYFIRGIKEMKANGATIIYTSHELETVELLSDRMIILKEGSVIHFDDIESIKKSYSNLVKISTDFINETDLKANSFNYTKFENNYHIAMDDREIDELLHLFDDESKDINNIDHDINMTLNDIYKLINMGDVYQT